MGNQPSGEQGANGQLPASQTPRQNNTTLSVTPSSPSGVIKSQTQSIEKGAVGGFYTQKSYTSLKVLIRGGPGSGKTALFNALQGLEFIPEYNPSDQLQYGKVSWSPHSAVSALASAEFLKRSDTTGLHETTQFKMNPQIDTDIAVTIELVDAVDTGRRQLIPTHKLPNKSSLPPNIDLIDGNYYLPPVDSSTVDVWKNASALLLCVDPYSLPTYHYAVNILSSIPEALLSQGFSVVLCLIKRDLPAVDRAVSDHMLNMLTTGTSIKTLHISCKNGYGLEKLRNFLLIPYLTNRSLEYHRLSELYKHEATLVTTFMTQLISGDDDYYHYVQMDNHNQDHNNTLMQSYSGNNDHNHDDDDDLTSFSKTNSTNPNDFDYMMQPQRNQRGGRFDDIDIEPDKSNLKTKVKTNKASLSNSGAGLKLSNEDMISTKRSTGNSLDDFFGGTGDDNGDDDIIIPVKKEKKKVKKTTKVEQQQPSPPTTMNSQSPTSTKSRSKKSTTTPSFFEDDLDLEPVQPRKQAPLTQSKIALQQSQAKRQQLQQQQQQQQQQQHQQQQQQLKTTTQKPSFGGFFDDENDDNNNQRVAPHLLRPSSSHQIDEEAELAFFDGGDDDDDHTEIITPNPSQQPNDQEQQQQQQQQLLDHKIEEYYPEEINHDDELAAFDSDDEDDSNTNNGNKDTDQTSNPMPLSQKEPGEEQPTKQQQPLEDEEARQQSLQEQSPQVEQKDSHIDLNRGKIVVQEEGEEEEEGEKEEGEEEEGEEEGEEEEGQVQEEKEKELPIITESLSAVDEPLNREDQPEEPHESTTQSLEEQSTQQLQHPWEEDPLPSVQSSLQESELQQDSSITQSSSIPDEVKDVSPANTPTLFQKNNMGAFFDDNDDIIPIKPHKKATPKPSPVQSPPSAVKSNNGFFDDEVDEDVIVPTSKVTIIKKTPVLENKMSTPTSPAFGEFDDDDDDVLPISSPSVKKKAIPKKQTALEKQMAQLKKEEEEKRNREENASFTFKAKPRSNDYMQGNEGGFYD